MPVDLHLFSMPGIDDLRYVVAASRPYLDKQEHPLLAYLPWASTDPNNKWLAVTQETFEEFTELVSLDPDPTSRMANEWVLGRCGAVYISGGNTYLLNHLLHTSGLYEPLRQRASAGLPLIGFSAGALLCGPNILTSHDINMVPTTHFESLNLLPFNIVAHYPAEDAAREDEDDWLSDYHVLHDNPILALENDAYVRWNGEALQYIHGGVWILEQRKGRIRLE